MKTAKEKASKINFCFTNAAKGNKTIQCQNHLNCFFRLFVFADTHTQTSRCTLTVETENARMIFGCCFESVDIFASQTFIIELETTFTVKFPPQTAPVFTKKEIFNGMEFNLQ